MLLAGGFFVPELHDDFGRMPQRGHSRRGVGPAPTYEVARLAGR